MKMVWKALVWGIIGMVAGGWLGGLLVGAIGLPNAVLYIVGLAIGILAFVSSYKNEGHPPKWLWRSKGKKEPKK